MPQRCVADAICPNPSVSVSRKKAVQTPARHCSAVEHMAPAARFATQVVPLQKKPGEQSPVDVHVVGQAAVAPQRSAPHPASVEPGVSWQVPRPLERSHRSHAPVHAVSQHTPSEQLPEEHTPASPPLQLCPLLSLPPHVPLMHWTPETHCVPASQLWGHEAAVPLQRYGAHDGRLPASPAPMVVQVPVAQLSQPSPHAVLQQTPSAQKPEAHWLGPEHCSAFAFFGAHIC